MLKREVREMVKYLIIERESFKVVFANGNEERVEYKGYCWVLNGKAYNEQELISKMVQFQNNEKKFIIRFTAIEEVVESEEVENLNDDLFQEDIISYCEEAIERELNIDKPNQSKGDLKMNEEFIKVNYETIGVLEQRNLIEMATTLGRAMTKEEYFSIILVYKKVIDRLVSEAEKQGINI